MKKYRVIYWISTSLIFIFQGVMPALTSQTEMAKEGISHLGYPEYFGIALAVSKVIGAVILIIPKIPNLIKEWAYAGFTFDFIFATVSLVAVDGLLAQSFFPLIALIILMVSYFCFHKITNNSAAKSRN